MHMSETRTEMPELKLKDCIKPSPQEGGMFIRPLSARTPQILPNE